MPRKQKNPTLRSFALIGLVIVLVVCLILVTVLSFQKTLTEQQLQLFDWLMTSCTVGFGSLLFLVIGKNLLLILKKIDVDIL